VIKANVNLKQKKDIVFLKAGTSLIPISSVEHVNLKNIEQGSVEIIYQNGKHINAEGFDAIEALMILKPGALEGKRLRWLKNAWAFHNFIAHPVMQILVWLGMKKQAIWLHDVTVPKPSDFRQRTACH